MKRGDWGGEKERWRRLQKRLLCSSAAACWGPFSPAMSSAAADPYAAAAASSSSPYGAFYGGRPAVYAPYQYGDPPGSPAAAAAASSPDPAASPAAASSFWSAYRSPSAAAPPAELDKDRGGKPPPGKKMAN